MFFRRLTPLIVFSIGCAEQQYGQCDLRNSELEIMYKPATLTHSFCIVCNTAISPDEYESWGIEMGATQFPTSYDSVHPCLYAYTANKDSIDSMEECKTLICDGNAVYSDFVGTNNGNVDLSSILED